MQRPHPADAPRAPAHGLGPGEFAHDGRHRFGDDGGRRAAGLFGAHQIIAAALRVLHDLAFLKALEPRSAQETLDRFFRRAYARAFALLDRGGRLFGHAFRDVSDAPRPRKRAGAPLRRAPPAPKPRSSGGQGLRRRALACGQGFLRRKIRGADLAWRFGLAQSGCRSFRNFARDTSEIPRNSRRRWRFHLCGQFTAE